jgi:hypothetical protein
MNWSTDKRLRFFIKTGYFSLPFVVFFLIYIILDPFKVVRSYDNYYDNYDGSKLVYGATVDRDYVNTALFDRYYQEHKYNSYIFGSSRSTHYEIADWKCFLDENSSCFHYDAMGESLYGIYKKIKYIDEKKRKIDNVLLILDYATLSQAKSSELRYFLLISPRLEKYKNIIPFHTTHISAFSSPSFFVAYLDYRISGKIKPYMKGKIGDNELLYDLKTNEMIAPLGEEFIKKGAYYTEEKMKIFYQRDSIQHYWPVVIQEPQKKMLSEIYEVFCKNRTNFKVIISPIYDQKKLNKQDSEYLKLLFGAQNVFNFSGINEFTNNYINYYDDSHYRPHVAKEIMRLIYQNRKEFLNVIK